jgi:hypothetical protein
VERKVQPAQLAGRVFKGRRVDKEQLDPVRKVSLDQMEP